MLTTNHLLTADELWKLPSDQRRELVKGELRVMAPSGFDHGAVMFNLGRCLANYVADQKLGVVVGGETGFRLAKNPDTVRGADIAFVAAARVPTSGRPAGYWEGAPDLAIEIVSPNDTLEEVEAKVDEYLNAGAQLVWVVNPKRKSITVHRPNSNPAVLRDKDTLEGDEIIPGFRFDVADAFS